MKRIIISTLLVMLCLVNVVLAADMTYRFTHNDHDVLIVGTITQIDESKIKANVATTIVSTAYLNQVGKKVQLNPVKVTIDITNLNLYTEFKEGDYILASLDKTLLDYKVANGLYKVDSTDIKSLKIICDEEDRSPDLAAIEYFVNSNGVINEFTFENDSVKIKDPNSDEELIIYTKNDDGYNETIELEAASTEQEVLAKDYDDAMVVTIILTAGIMAVIILIKFRTKVND